MMEPLQICTSLYDKENNINTWKYCAPIYLTGSFGTLLSKKEDLVSEEMKDSLVRNGTITFVSYKEEYFAITCKHVLHQLTRKQEIWRKEFEEQAGYLPGYEGVHFYIPKDLTQHHFNYELSPVPPNIDDKTRSDIAIARIDYHFIQKLGREHIGLSKMNKTAKTGIASGYPELQRGLVEGSKGYQLAQKNASCSATMQFTDKYDILLNDPIVSHEGLNELSGMSGGPIIWSNNDNFGLAGIVRCGANIQSEEGELAEGNKILIYGERITPALFDGWLNSIPSISKHRDQTKTLYIPNPA